MRAKAIQICGTGSGVGKSVLTTALCRIFYQDGYKVAPFKAQNMSLNSYVTDEGAEIGRAQAEQARAARIEPSKHMNPILLKPSGERAAQVILQGKPIGNMSAVEYARRKKSLSKKVYASYETLARKYDAIIIEGAGSPAEINLKKHDIVNMKMAEYARAGVILVGDIDKGGVFAHLIGTLELLDKNERDRIKGFIINKFRGDKRLLSGGLKFLEKRTGKKVIGVIPYFNGIKIMEEDSVSLNNRTPAHQNTSTPEHQHARIRNKKTISIAVIHLPYISNFTDFDALERESKVSLRYVKTPKELDGADVIIIPGTKNTILDLTWLKYSGLASKILSALNFQLSAVLIGICGGYQMLGEVIYDSCGIESARKEIKGLGLLPITTIFKPEKVLRQTEAVELKSGIELKGYEIHHGITTRLKSCRPMFKIRGKARFDGSCLLGGRIWGTYLHGVFDNARFRRNFLSNARRKIGIRDFIKPEPLKPEREFDKLASLVRKNIDMRLVYKILKNAS